MSSSVRMDGRRSAAGLQRFEGNAVALLDRDVNGVLPGTPPSPHIWGRLDHLPDAPVIVEGRAADHPAVQCFLGEVFPGPQRDAFVAALEDPFYEPRDRLLVKRGAVILGHVTVAHRVQRWGSLRAAVTDLRRLGTAPEETGQGIAGRLLDVAERRMRKDAATVATLSTQIPHFFRRFGYAVCGRCNVWRLNAQHLLATLPAAVWRCDVHAQFTTRPWRQIELPALMHIYNRALAGAHGPLERTEAFWRWLVSRQQYDRIYVAIHGRDRCELQRDERDAVQSPIVGYAVIKEDCVLELLTLPEYARAAEQLLARAAAETIERDRQELAAHLPPHHALTEVLTLAGGKRHYQEYWQGQVTMVKLLDPLRILQALRDTLYERARLAEIATPWELTFSADGDRYALAGTRRSVKVSAARRGASRRGIALGGADFTRLLLGHLDVREAHLAGRVRASSARALETAAALFPQLPLWTPPWDGMGL